MATDSRRSTSKKSISVQSEFKRLLLALEEEHEREVAKLQRERDVLQQQPQGGAPSMPPQTRLTQHAGPPSRTLTPVSHAPEHEVEGPASGIVASATGQVPQPGQVPHEEHAPRVSSCPATSAGRASLASACSVDSEVIVEETAGKFYNSESALQTTNMGKKANVLIKLRESQDDPEAVRRACFRVWADETRRMRSPVNFVLRSSWLPDAAPGEHDQTKLLNKTRTRSIDYNQVVPFVRTSRLEQRGIMTKLLLHPSCRSRVVWDLVGAILLFFDIIMIPVSAFGIMQGPFMSTMDWVTLIYWSLDMFASCVTGYVSEGVTVMDARRIALHYMRTWLLLDILTVVPEWVYKCVELLELDHVGGGLGSGASSGRLLRTVRLLRMSRLLRLVKLQRIIAMIRDCIDSEVMFIAINVFKLILMLLIVNHILASVWYAIGDVSRELSWRNWIDMYDFDEEPLHYRYITSLHWSLTQFTPASMAVQPTNSMERGFAVMVLVFGLVLFSSFVSSITNSMTQLRSMQDDKSKQFWLLRRYLNQRRISKQLSFRVLRYAEYACREHEDLVAESRIWVMALLSEQLRNELHYAVSFSCMVKHPLFEKVSAITSVTMHQLSSSALSQESLAAGDQLFCTGTAASYMHFVVLGRLQYDRFGEENDGVFISPEDWLCEAALWTEWFHLGTVHATTECKLVSLGVESFGKIISQDLCMWELTSKYARRFLLWLSSMVCGKLTDVSFSSIQRSRAALFLDEEVADGELEDEKEVVAALPQKLARGTRRLRGSIVSMASSSRSSRASKASFFSSGRSKEKILQRDFSTIVQGTTTSSNAGPSSTA